MNDLAVAVPAFLASALVSLLASWLLVSRLERLGVRFGISEGLLGLAAAVAADGPEIASAVSAVLAHQRDLGAGVVLGSNLFNLAALLGLAALVAGSIDMHRHVVAFAGTLAVVVALLCELAVTALVPVDVALVGVLLLVCLYGAALGLDVPGLARLGLPARWCAWICLAVGEEDEEQRALLPRAGNRLDGGLALGALVVVIAASVVMERAASAAGRRAGVPPIVTGGLALAAVTGLPNAVAAVYLARRGRGTAVLSTVLNSNAVNVAFGLLVPAALLGLAPPSSSAVLVVTWYLALTVASLALIYARAALRRAGGAAIIGAYLVFVVSLLGVSGAW